MVCGAEVAAQLPAAAGRADGSDQSARPLRQAGLLSADPAALKRRLAEEARALGFTAFGVADPTATAAAGPRLDAWLAEGAHGDMLWMETTAQRRASPAALWPEVRAVVMLGMPYTPAVDPRRPLPGGAGRISVYALGADYHDVIKKRLKTLAQWLTREVGAGGKLFVDTAPVMEKPLAEAAGIGWQGKHTNLVNRTEGSWLFLSALYLDFALPFDTAHADRCGSCTACQTACPTAAFPTPYRIDARRCVSYLTIEHNGPIPRELRTGIGDRIYGCDDCLSVCPWNSFASPARREPAFAPRAELLRPELADLLGLDDAAFREVFAGSPIKRIGRDRMVRNALIAAANSGEAALLPTVEKLLDDAVPLVRGAAAWALRRMAPTEWAGRRAQRLERETDGEVLEEWR